MAKYLILTEAQAASLCGAPGDTLAMDGKPWAALRPIPLPDGRYVLPADLLASQDFAEVHDQLAAFPVVDLADSEFIRAA